MIFMLNHIKFPLIQKGLLLLKISPTLLLLYSALILTLILSYRRRHYYKFSSRVPGPPQWPLLGCAKLRYEGPEGMVTMLHHYVDYFRTLGSCIAGTFYGDKYLIVSLSPAYTNFFLTKILKKSDLYQAVSNLFRDGVLGLSTIAKWRVDRKMIGPSFNHSVIKTYISIFFEESNLLVQKCHPLMQRGEAFYPGDLLNLATFDMVIRSTLGENPRAQDHSDHPAVRAMMDILNSIHVRLSHPFLMRDFWSNLLGYTKLEKSYEKIFRDFTRDIVRRIATQDSQEKSFSFATHMMQNEMDEEDLITHVVNVVFAGTDTTKTANFAVLLMLAIHPEVQEKAYQELTSILGCDKTREPTYEELLRMNYLEMVIKEALRLFPPVPIVARQVSTDSDKLEDLQLPKGASIVLDIYMLHRDARYFPNPDLFDPERFTLTESAKRPIGSYLPFLFGSRDCIGRKYAMLQVKTVVSTLLRNYRILPSQTCGTMEEVEILIQTTSKFAPHCQIKLKSRD
uniref:Cytochrome P450 4V2 n=2 Tax=Cacopsylla melanoneura TaxID=428564 RepID=A0A8D8PTJ3_9HEMI